MVRLNMSRLRRTVLVGVFCLGAASARAQSMPFASESNPPARSALAPASAASQFSTGRKPRWHFGKGAIIGAVVGGSIGTVLGMASCDSDTCWQVVTSIGATFGGIGLWIGGYFDRGPAVVPRPRNRPLTVSGVMTDSVRAGVVTIQF